MASHRRQHLFSEDHGLTPLSSMATPAVWPTVENLILAHNLEDKCQPTWNWDIAPRYSAVNLLPPITAPISPYKMCSKMLVVDPSRGCFPEMRCISSAHPVPKFRNLERPMKVAYSSLSNLAKKKRPLARKKTHQINVTHLKGKHSLSEAELDLRAGMSNPLAKVARATSSIFTSEASSQT